MVPGRKKKKKRHGTESYEHGWKRKLEKDMRSSQGFEIGDTKGMIQKREKYR